MREIKLRVTKIDLKNITGEDKSIDFDYKYNILEVLNSTVGASFGDGMTIEDIEKRLNIRKKVQTSTDVLLLEESDYEYLKKLVLEEKWKIADQVIIDYVNDIKNAPKVN